MSGYDDENKMHKRKFLELLKISKFSKDIVVIGLFSNRIILFFVYM